MMGLSLCLEYNTVVFPSAWKHNRGVFVCKTILDNKFSADTQVMTKISSSDSADKIIALQMKQQMKEVLEYRWNNQLLIIKKCISG